MPKPTFLQREQIDFPIHEQLDERYIRGHAQTGRRRAGLLSDVRDGSGQLTPFGLVSTGTGATTCGYFFPGDRRVLYSSTHASGPNCPPKPKRDGAYRWALDDYDIYAVRIDGQEMQRLTSTPGYDAEATVSPDGKTIVWTSVKDGDLDLYAMNLDGSKPRRLTNEIGYDGGAFFRRTASASSTGRRIPPIRRRLTSTRTCSTSGWWNRGNLKFS